MLNLSIGEKEADRGFKNAFTMCNISGLKNGISKNKRSK